METYLMMMYVTLEQENAIRELFLQKGWCLMKIDDGKDAGKDPWKGREVKIIFPKIISKSHNVPAQHNIPAQHNPSTDVQRNDLVKPLDILKSDIISLNPYLSKFILPEDKSNSKIILSSQTPLAETDNLPVKKAKLSHSFTKEKYHDSNDKFVNGNSSCRTKQVCSESVTQSAKEIILSSVDTDDDSVLATYDIQYEVNTVDDTCGSLERVNNLNEAKCILHGGASSELEAVSMNKLPPEVYNFDPTMVQGRDKKGKFTTEKVPGSGKPLGTEDNQFFLTCKDCKKRLPSHQFNCHKDRGECVVKCSCCGVVFEGKDLANYKAHVKTHCKCEICHSMFMIESDLKIHMKTHVGQRMFACTCGAMFASAFDLNAHSCSMKNTK